ncbi:MAG: nucleoside hydrolase [Clostridia bacterium]|nr:nucleoside hydrolase [Clostridia bacterium]
MRKFIIDTDTGSDDAAAIIIAALNRNIDLLGVTTVAGNVSVEQATKNALMTLEVCEADAPVYIGAGCPLLSERKETISVHGADGMGDCGIINPKRSAQTKRAVDFILDTVSEYPDEVELVVLGPATNIALAVLTDRETMKKAKHIWSMGTPGFGPGNATPVAEFNVFIDAEAYAVMLESGIPITIAGFDLCTGKTGLGKKELAALAGGNKIGKFLERATSQLLQFKLNTRQTYMVDLPDALAMAAALWDGFVLDSVNCYCKCCTQRNETHGQVIFYRQDRTYEAVSDMYKANAEVITEVDENLFIEKLIQLMV